jgi:hypothetical protein
MHFFLSFVCQTEAFAVCENYSPPEGFKEKDLYHLLEKVGTPSGADDLGKAAPPTGQHMILVPQFLSPFDICHVQTAEADGWRDQIRFTFHFWLAAISAATTQTGHTHSRAQKVAPTGAWTQSSLPSLHHTKLPWR